MSIGPDEDPVSVSADAAARLPHVPLVSISDEPRPAPEALVACGVEDHVPMQCVQCPGSPRLKAAIRWAIERRELLERVENLRLDCEKKALHDPLTTLPNRTLLRDRLRHLLARNTRSRNTFALLFIDLDGFKGVNDELGHAAGDELLIEVARRLRSRVRGGDTCSRWGGDEFLVLLEEVSGSSAATRVAADLLSVLAEPMLIAGRRIRMHASIGVSRFPGDGRDAETLIRNADLAMYDAKAAGGGAIRCARSPAPPKARTKHETQP